MVLAGTGGGIRFGGRHFRREHLLLIRCCLRRFLSSGGRCRLLRRPRSHLAETRGSWHSRWGLWFAAPADAGSCQQVLCSGRWQCVHGFDSGRSRRQVTRGSHPSCRGTSCGLSGGDHSHVARCRRCPQSRSRARSLARDCRSLTPLADSKTASAVSHHGESLQPVQDTNYVCLWAIHCCLRRPSHVRGDFLHLRGPLEQVNVLQVDCKGPG